MEIFDEGGTSILLSHPLGAENKFGAYAKGISKLEICDDANTLAWICVGKDLLLLLLLIYNTITKSK